MKQNILFLLKQRSVYNDGEYSSLSSGLYNSARFVADMLAEQGFTVNLKQVVDANSIDRYVTLYRPDTVVIEALWVVPDKFKELVKLHPTVKWIVRLHSNIVFLANEGMAIGWIREYDTIDNVHIAVNSKDAEEVLELFLIKPLIYFPNYYPTEQKTINVGCFGSIRPLKNQLIQAIAAIEYANQEDVILQFHINATRNEQKGENVLKNIRALFKDTKHLLIEHDWLDHEEFISLVKYMDVGLQVSLSETYNIVAADFVSNFIPIVTSNEIDFIIPECQASTQDVNDIVRCIRFALYERVYVCTMNQSLLLENSEEAKHNIIKILKKK